MTTTKSPTTLHATTFGLSAPDAQSVFIAGSFNEWSQVTHPMEKAESGEWELVVELPAGRYEYKFIVDGQWCCEAGWDGPLHECTGCCSNEFGTSNRVIDVP